MLFSLATSNTVLPGSAIKTLPSIVILTVFSILISVNI